MVFALAFVFSSVCTFMTAALDLGLFWGCGSVFLVFLVRRDWNDSFILEAVLEVGRNDEREVVKEGKVFVTDPFVSVFRRVDSLERVRSFMCCIFALMRDEMEHC